MTTATDRGPIVNTAPSNEVSGSNGRSHAVCTVNRQRIPFGGSGTC